MMRNHHDSGETRSHEEHSGRRGHHGQQGFGGLTSEGRGRRYHHPEGPGPRGGRRMGGRPHRGEGRGRGRAQRGDIRAATLLLLADEPMHGYQLMQAIATRTDGAWRPSPGAIYPTIAQLEDEGLVTITPDSGRKLVTLTEAGREHLASIAETMPDPFTAVTEQAGGRHVLRGAVEQLNGAARAVAMSGTEAQIVAAQEILSQARRSLYLILAEEDQPENQPEK
ncbi:MAG: transcriptional regulator, PadR-like family [Mycobacterium sp.]|nr:transcriptional regulator, PadR-like family [Mycobacterium sp.]